jgi:quercetin dioxygenase-like cupin family protein
MPVLDERDVAHAGKKTCNFRAEDIQESADFRAGYNDVANVVLSEDQPFEESPDGLIKHLVHEKLNTREMCVDAYMQFLEPGKSTGKHRHMWEEVIFVLEGSGYDLHWDVKFDCIDEYNWEWEEEPKHNEWKRGDFIYVPPYSTHQHFNSGDTEARLIVISNRIIKKMGFNWLDQVENAPGK